MNLIKIEIEKMKKSTIEYAKKGQHIISIGFLNTLKNKLLKIVQINTEEIQKLKLENERLKNHFKRLSRSGSSVSGLTDDSELLQQKYRDPDFFESSGGK